jgi:ABC-type transport system involved in cytochrome bd biosynthesis fused ATPase/permease subunit
VLLAHKPARRLQAARQGPLELRDVHFAYPVRPEVPVLQGVSIVLPKGSVTAVVGRSGAGKSTVAALLSRWVGGRVRYVLALVADLSLGVPELWVQVRSLSCKLLVTILRAHLRCATMILLPAQSCGTTTVLLLQSAASPA